MFNFDTLYETGTWQVVAVLDTTLGADELPYYTFLTPIRNWIGRSGWMPSLNWHCTIPV